MSELQTIEVTPFIDGFTYGEGPRWHDGRLWFTDGPAGRVYSAGVRGDVKVEAELDHPSGLGWPTAEFLMVSTLFEARIHRVDRGGAVVATHELGDMAWSTNDLTATAEGRAYVDLYQADESGLNGAIALIEPDGSARVVATGINIPNGLAVLPDGSALIVAETFTSKLLTFPIGPGGDLGAPGVFADLGTGRHPDGICLDTDGAVWVGCYDTSEFLRVLPGGVITDQVPVDSGWAVAPALGGIDGRTLYLVVNDTTHEKLVAGQSQGRILQARVDVPGAQRPT